MDLFQLAQQSGRLLSALDSKRWDAAIAQDHQLHKRLDDLWNLALKRHTRRYNEYQKICKQSTGG